MQPDFKSMNHAELRAYPLEQRNNSEAFHALMDLLMADPDPKYYSIDELHLLPQLIEERRKAKKQPDH
ncbi:DUF6887 family protein [Phormidesmis priestleyi]